MSFDEARHQLLMARSEARREEARLADAQARAEALGAARNALENVRRFLAAGVARETIARCTGVDPSQLPWEARSASPASSPAKVFDQTGRYDRRGTRERELYEDRFRAACDEASRLDYAKKRGEARGTARKAMEIARRMLAARLDQEFVARHCGLTVDVLTEDALEHG